MSESKADIYKSMFENAVEGMYRTTVDGDFIAANLALARMHGCDSVEEFKATFGSGNPVYSSWEDRDAVVGRIAREGRIHGLETLGRRKDGSTFWMLESGRALFDGNGEVTGYEGFIEDISAIKEIEQELIRARELAETADKVKTDVLSNLGHELRTPLNSIIGFSEIILKLCEEQARDDEVTGYAGEIHESAGQLLSVINTLLEFSQINAGLALKAFDDVDVIALIHSFDRRYQSVLEENGLTLELNLCRETPALHAEERALRRALENVLSNAVKFTPSGGRIALTVAVTEEAGVTVSVLDSGVGFGKEDAPRAFAPFEQIDPSRAREYAGVGLGLPMARTLIEQLGGQLTLESVPGHGTCVQFHFPSTKVRILHRIDE